MADFFYDQQIRRFMIQFAKMFSQWYVTRGKDANGNDILVRIPVMYGNGSRMVSTILADNSASSLPSAPLITYYISGLEYDQRRTQEPFFIDKMQVRQRKYNTDTRTYETTQGQAFTIERPMPVPYTLRMTVDLWTTNENQKLQFIEQLGTLFNPSWEIQSTDNFVDWTSLSVVYQDGITYSSRSVPAGTNNPLDILTWKFYMPIWISQPIKLKKMGVVNKIIASIYKGNALDDIQDDDLLLGTRQKITPYGYKLLLWSGVEVDGKVQGALQVYPNNTAMNPRNSELEMPEPEDTRIMWSAFLNMYGAIRPGISQIWLQNPYMETEIVGTINLDPMDDRLLSFSIDADTLPQDTLGTVTSVINPLVKGPFQGLNGYNSNGAAFPPMPGQRHVLVENIGRSTSRISIPGSMLGGSSPINDMEFVITSVGPVGDITSIGQFTGINPIRQTTGFYTINIPSDPVNAQIQFSITGSNSNTTSYSDSSRVSYNLISGGSNFVANDATVAWGELVANANDIIECVSVDTANNTSIWTVVFDSQLANQTGTVEYVTNTTTGIQYRYADGAWMKSFEGWYVEGDYSIVI